MIAYIAPTILEIGVWIAVLGTPLAWSSYFAAEYAMPKIVVLSIGALVAVVGLAAKGLRRTPLDPIIALWALVLAVTAWIGQDPVLSLVGEYNSYTYGVLGMGLYACLYLVSAQFGPAERRRAVNVALGAGVLVALYAIIQGIGREPFAMSVPISNIAGRAVSTIGSPVHLGAYLALLIPVASSRCSEYSGDGYPFWMAFTIVLVNGLAATFSRGAWLAAAVGCGAFLVLRHGRFGAAIVLGLSLMGAAAVGPRLTGQRVQLGDSDTGRIEGWKMAWEAYRESPVFGNGPDTFGLISRRFKTEAFVKATSWRHHHAHAHNDFLHILATMGTLGGVAYLGTILALLREAWRRREDGEAMGLACGLLALLVNTQINPASLEVYAVAAVITGALAPAGDHAL